LLSLAARDTCSSIARNDGASPISAILSGVVTATLAKDANNYEFRRNIS
jgi:hypothetical protein